MQAGKEAQNAMLGSLMDRLKDAQKMVRDETAKLQAELTEYVTLFLFECRGSVMGGAGGGVHRFRLQSPRMNASLAPGPTVCTPPDPTPAPLGGHRSQYEGFSEDETVRVAVDGNQRPVSVDITEAAYSLGPERLGELVLQAAREAHANSIGAMQGKMQTLAQNLGLPNVGGQ